MSPEPRLIQVSRFGKTRSFIATVSDGRWQAWGFAPIHSAAIAQAWERWGKLGPDAYARSMRERLRLARSVLRARAF